MAFFLWGKRPEHVRTLKGVSWQVFFCAVDLLLPSQSRLQIPFGKRNSYSVAETMQKQLRGAEKSVSV